MITIYGRADSSNVQAVMWGAAELGLSPERLDYGHRFGGTDSPAFRALSPHGLVPVLKDGETAVFESCAILRYLAAEYGDGGAFWPAGNRARAEIDKWAEWCKLNVCIPFTVPIFWARVRTAAADRDAAALSAAIALFETRLATIQEQMRGHDYLCGDSLTLADIVLGHLLYRYFDIDIPRADLPVISDYYARLAGRPTYAEHVMISYDALKDPNAG